MPDLRGRAMSFAHVKKAAKPAVSGSRIIKNQDEPNNHATSVVAETVATAEKAQQALR
jgi:hypothetical protein